MAYVALFFKLLPTILGLIPYAEKLFSDRPKSGKDKKDFVLGVTEQLVAGADAVFTGGAADTWARIKPLAGLVIDAGASIAFPHEDPQRGMGY